MPSEDQVRAAIERMSRSTSRRAFGRAEGELKELDKIFSRYGEELPEPREGILSTIFDTLDTGGQFVRGLGAKVAGVEGYGDRGFIDAGLEGTRQDLTVGEILRKKGIFAEDDLGSSIGRASLGFVGDVLTDPLTYLTLGAGAGAKLGNQAINAGKFALREGGEETLQNLALKYSDDLFNVSKGTFDDLLSKGKITAEELPELLARAQTEAGQESYKLIAGAKSLLETKNQVGRAGLEALGDDGAKLADDILLDFKSREGKIRDAFGLADDVAIEDLFQKPGIRFTSPFAGMDSFSSIPILRERSADIPFVTPASEKVYEFLGGKLYNARLKTVDLSTKALDAVEQIGGPPKSLISMMRTAATTVPKWVSKTADAGSKAKRLVVEEHSIADSAIRADATQQLELRFQNFNAMAGEDAKKIREDTFRIFESALVRKDGSPNIKGSLARDLQIDPNKLQKNLAGLRADLNTRTPGLGDEAIKMLEMTRSDFDQQGLEGLEKGILESTVDDYVPNIYQQAKGFEDPAKLDKLKKAHLVNDFSLERVFATATEAAQNGMKPTFDLQEVLLQRTIAQRKALAEKDFIERMGYEFGLSKGAYKNIQKLVRNKNYNVSKSAVDFLRRMDIDEAPILKKLFDEKGTFGKKVKDTEALASFSTIPDDLSRVPIDFKMRMRSGEFVTPEGLNRLKTEAYDQRFSYADDIRKHAQEELKFLNIKPEQEPLVGVLAAHFDEYKKGLLGREGETVFTRGGTELANEQFRKFVSKHTDPETARMFNGVLPRSLVKVANDSLTQRSILKDISRKLKTTDSKMAKALGELGENYVGWVNNLKFSYTQLWPSFFARNLGGAPFQGLPAASTLGDQFSPRRLLQTSQISRGYGKLVQEGTGRVIDAKQLNREAKISGMLSTRGVDAADIVDAQNGILYRMAKKLPLGEAFDKFSTFIENHGREHLFYNLRRAGYDAPSAANETRRLLIDYARGKTPFERDILNNIFFFYSFARGNLVNQAQSLLTRPGALTSQLHAINGVKELLLDPNAFEPTDEESQKLRTLRGSETISKFIGRGESGNPIVLQNVGTPVEDMARFLSVKTPNKFTVGEIVNAGIDSGVRTSQTLLASTNPIISNIVKMVSGKDFFFDREISDVTLRKFPKLSADVPSVLSYPFKAIPDPVWKALDKTTQAALDGYDNGDGTFTANPYMLAFFSMIVPGIDRYRSTRGNLINENIPDSAKILRTISGIKAVEVDPEKSIIFDQLREAKKIANRKGIPITKTQVKKRRLIDSLVE